MSQRMVTIFLTALAVGTAGEVLASTGQARCVVTSGAAPYEHQVFDVTWFRPAHMNCLQLDSYKLISGATDDFAKVYGRVREAEPGGQGVSLDVYAGDVPAESWVLMSTSSYLVRRPLAKMFALTGKTVYLKDGAPAGRDEVLAKGNVYVNANVFYLNETKGVEMPETKPFP